MHNVHFKNLSSDHLNEMLREVDVPQEVKLEIKKAVLNKQVGLLEDAKQRYDELLPRIKEDAEYVKSDIEIEYQRLEERIKKGLNKMEERFDKFLDKF